MNYSNKGKAKYILAWSCPLLFILLTYCFEGFAGNHYRVYNESYAVIDTPPPVKKNPDSNFVPKKTPDSIHRPSIKEITKTVIVDTTLSVVTDTFHFKRSKDSLDAPVVYHADDSMVVDVPGQKMYLYGKVSSVHYNTNELSAPEIQFDQRTSIMSAYIKKDSAGKVISYPYFADRDLKSVSDSIFVNMRTGKGLTKGTYTRQDDIYIYATKIKKADTSSFFALGTRFTTCDLDTPHFAFVAKKALFQSKKWAYTGPVHAEFEGVPIPLPLPFGIFPLTQGKHSGLLAPSFAADAQQGLSLQHLGYYKIFSPNWDMQTRANLYSYGGYLVDFNPRYYRRYHYQGNIDLSVQRTKLLDAPSIRTFNLSWTHTADTKSRPGVTFTANVQAGSTKFNELVSGRPDLNYKNQQSSTISYAKTWKNKPYNISVNANQTQNSVDRLINLYIPDVAFNVNTLYPFRRKEPVGDYKWYENIGIAYNGTTKSFTSFYDTAGQISQQISHNFQYGAHHSVPLSLSLPPLGVVQLSPSVTYDETWYQTKLMTSYDSAGSKFDTLSLKKGFYTARQMTFGISASTRIFGLFAFGKNSRIKAIRHEIRPSISANYSPNMNGANYYKTKVDAFGMIGYQSYFAGGIYSPYSNQRFGGLSFQIDNNISAKIRNRKDTAATADKKISLLDGLSISGGYNFLADSFRLSDFSVSARTTISDKINIGYNATFDPYQTNAQGARVDKLILGNKFSIGNLRSSSVTLQTSFKGGDKSKKTPLQNLDQSGLAPGATLNDYQQEAAYIQNNPSEFVDFTIPWSVDLSYSLSDYRIFNAATGKFKSTLTQGVVFNASANLTERWKVGLNGTYNITDHQLAVLSGYLSRDLHCWQLGINFSPIGRSRFFSINISPKSPILQDLKINRTRSFSDF